VSILVDACACLGCGYIELHAAQSSKGKLNALAHDGKNWQNVG
jgi:hypothetical protein